MQMHWQSNDDIPYRSRMHWQSNYDTPDRRRILFCIVKVIEQMRPDASKITLARILEKHLYWSAASKEEYSNVFTLNNRLQRVANALRRTRRVTTAGWVATE